MPVEHADPQTSGTPTRTPQRPGRRRRSEGRRQKQRRRRRQVLRTALSVVLLGALAGLGVWGATQLDLRSVLPGSGPDDPVRPVAPTSTLVFVTIDESSQPPDTALVFVLDATLDPPSGTILYVPTTTVADIPGHGLDQLGRAYTYAGAPLLLSTIDNLLGVDFDGVVTINTSGWAALFSRIGGLTIDVPSRIVAPGPDGTAEVRFEPGTQHLDGPRLAEYLTAGEPSASLDRVTRASDIMDAFLDRLAQDPSLLDEVFAGGAPMFQTAVDAGDLRAVFEAAVEAREAEALDPLVLPVTPVGSGEDGSLRIEQDRVEELVAERFADSVPDVSGPGGRRLQILNGNGEPGIGQHVAERLVPAGFVVRLTDNANTFDHEITKILVYDDSPAQMELARQVRDLLGVGQIEISRTPQSVVDMTIVVGHDFLREIDR